MIFPFLTLKSLNSTGLTSSGLSNVLCAWIVSAVRISPLMSDWVLPVKSIVTVAVSSRLTLVRVMCVAPLASLDAVASHTGTDGRFRQ